jgi:hypothetical protein
MKSKTKLKKLAKAALLVATVSLTSCATDYSGHPELRYPSDGILHLKKGDNYIAQGNETWYSLLRYQQVERDAINSAAALKQQKNH